MKKDRIYVVTKIFTEIILCVAVIALFSVPFWVDFIRDYYRANSENLNFLIVKMIATLICAVMILWYMRRMLKTLVNDDPFTMNNVKSFGMISVFCLVAAGIEMVNVVVYFSVASAIITVIFVVGSLLCMTLKHLFRQAVEYKQENDWTV